jgi:hypothetical protein
MFIAWPKTPRLENEVFHITEKIDGTNACIVIQQEAFDTFINHLEVEGLTYYIGAQSRSRLLSLEVDHYGLGSWVAKNAEQLILDLGVGHHFGEWWGQSINRGYELTEKRFSLFNPTKKSLCCHNIPYMAESCQEELNKGISECRTRLETDGSMASPGFMRPEGLVVYAEKSKSYWKVIIDK